MVNAGRILILAKGAWSSLTMYEQLDLVTYNKTAYLARQASVGVNPQTDTSYTYWQPFGEAADIATTTAPGIVMPDGVTITVDNTGLIQAALGVEDLSDVNITNLADGETIKYDSASSKWVNVTLGTAAYKNSTNAVTQASTDLVESGAVYTEINTLSDAISNKQSKTLDTSLTIDGVTQTTVEGALGALVTSNAGKATTTEVGNKHKVTSFEVTTSSWTQDTTSQSGTTLYKKSVSLTHVYVDSPSVDIGSTGVLPTVAQQNAYNLLKYVTVDSAIPCLYLYASDIPTDSFYINVEGVD